VAVTCTVFFLLLCNMTSFRAGHWIPPPSRQVCGGVTLPSSCSIDVEVGPRRLHCACWHWIVVRGCVSSVLGIRICVGDIGSALLHGNAAVYRASCRVYCTLSPGAGLTGGAAPIASDSECHRPHPSTSNRPHDPPARTNGRRSPTHTHREIGVYIHERWSLVAYTSMESARLRKAL